MNKNYAKYIPNNNLKKNNNKNNCINDFFEADGNNKNKSIVEDNVFIGSNSTIISPVVIKNDAIIGAGSVVNKDILPGDIVAGKPARSLKN